MVGIVLRAEQIIVNALTPFSYRGYCYDQYTGLYYLQSRYYDPTTGRFINADDTNYLNATGTVLGCNLFAYCENDPVNNVDPSGNAAIKFKFKFITINSNYKRTKNKISLSIVISTSLKAIRNCIENQGSIYSFLAIFAALIPDATVSKALGVGWGIVSEISKIATKLMDNSLSKKGNKTISLTIKINGTIKQVPKFKFSALWTKKKGYRNVCYSYKSVFIEKISWKLVRK